MKLTRCGLFVLLLLVGCVAKAGFTPEVVAAHQSVEARLLQGDFDGALSDSEVFRQKHPGNPYGYTMALNVLITDLSWDEDVARLKSEILRYANQTLFLCEPVLKEHPEDTVALHTCGQANFALGYLKALEGHAMESSRHVRRAMEQLRLVLELDPGMIDARLHLGLMNFYTINLPPFVRMLSKFVWFIPEGEAAEAMPNIVEVTDQGLLFKDSAQFILSDLLQKQNKPDFPASVDLLETLCSRYPGSWRLQYNLVEAYLANNELPKARGQLDMAPPVFEEKPEYHLLLARTAYAEENYDRSHVIVSDLKRRPLAKWLEDEVRQLAEKLAPHLGHIAINP